jgi:3-methyl-2-oxobutanoate hydroxymethyltransferase
MTERITAPSLRSRKTRLGCDPIVMLTAYDSPGGRIADAAGVDAILVGDTVAHVVLNHSDTLHIDVGVMAHHIQAVARSDPRALVVGDMPWLSYHLSVEDAVQNAAALVRAGAGAVKLEGGLRRVAAVRAIIDAEIPVIGHLGLTPQSVHTLGTASKVQAKNEESAEALIKDAEALETAGISALVLEAVPDVVAARVTEALDVPTIGIGAGPHCDGQVIVFHDLLGLTHGRVPKFVRQYADLTSIAINAVSAWADDVRARKFPSDSESYHMPAPQT